MMFASTMTPIVSLSCTYFVEINKYIPFYVFIALSFLSLVASFFIKIRSSVFE